VSIGGVQIRTRLDQLVAEGESIFAEFKKAKSGILEDSVRFTQWTTSCLNLLDKLSVSTNRFVKEFELWSRPDRSKRDSDANLTAALGALKSARDEYALGLAIEYHLSVSAAVFDGILDEGDYLMQKGYLRAAAVLIGAALEEGLKTRARAVGLEVGPRDTLNPIIARLKAPEVHVLTDFDAKRLEAIARMRNDAAHGGEFNYQLAQVPQALFEVRTTLEEMLRHS
jgi:hypothetical protein